MLTNVTYVGQVRHKGEIYPGEQEPIVSREIWDRANALLKKRRRGPDTQRRTRQGAIFQGLIDCGVCGHPMGAGYTMKRGRRYSFYVCQLTQKRGTHACPRQSISARLVERAVAMKLYDLAAANSVPGLGISLPHASWESLDSAHRRQIVEALIERVSYDHRQNRGFLAVKLNATEAPILIPINKNPCDRHGPLATAVVTKREVPSLARLMALAIHFDKLLSDGTASRFAALAAMARVSTARVSQLMKLLDLAPEIQEQLLFAPPETLHVGEATLRRIANEIDWRKQAQMFEDSRSPVE